MQIGDVYYEKHTVVGISERTNTVSETDVEIVNMLPIDVLDKIRAEADKQYKWLINTMYTIRDVDIAFGSIFRTIDKYRKESEE